MRNFAPGTLGKIGRISIWVTVYQIWSALKIKKKVTILIQLLKLTQAFLKITNDLIGRIFLPVLELLRV